MTQVQNFLTFTLATEGSPGRLIYSLIKQKSHQQDRASPEAKAMRINWLTVLLTIGSQVKCSAPEIGPEILLYHWEILEWQAPARGAPPLKMVWLGKPFCPYRPETSFYCPEAPGQMDGTSKRDHTTECVQVCSPLISWAWDSPLPRGGKTYWMNSL